MKLYYCKHCKNIIVFVKENKNLICCGEVLNELIPGTVDASIEKHVPVTLQKENQVSIKVGSVTHPMEEKHFIEWILLETTKGYYYRKLQPSDEPVANFTLQDDEKVVASYEYCNLHGLWKN